MVTKIRIRIRNLNYPQGKVQDILQFSVGPIALLFNACCETCTVSTQKDYWHSVIEECAGRQVFRLSISN